MKVARGRLESKFWNIIPLLIFVSESTITNAVTYETKGKVYSLHITPFITIGFVIPAFIIKKIK